MGTRARSTSPGVGIPSTVREREWGAREGSLELPVFMFSTLKGQEKGSKDNLNQE